MWTFHQTDGQGEDFKGFRYGRWYSGCGKGKNNPAMQDVHAGCRWDEATNQWLAIPGLSSDDWGVLPAGIYTMQAPVDTEKHGPFVMWLTPDETNIMFGRSGFGIHGDSIEHPGLASEGCICAPRAVREMMWRSNDHRIQVIL